jgi:hypothetical protein
MRAFGTVLASTTLLLSPIAEAIALEVDQDMKND